MISLDITAEQLDVLGRLADSELLGIGFEAKALARELGCESAPYLIAEKKMEEALSLVGAIKSKLRELRQLEEVRRRSGVAA